MLDNAESWGDQKTIWFVSYEKNPIIYVSVIDVNLSILSKIIETLYRQVVLNI
jgi:hypothetical protein